MNDLRPVYNVSEGHHWMSPLDGICPNTVGPQVINCCRFTVVIALYKICTFVHVQFSHLHCIAYNCLDVEHHVDDNLE